MSNKKKAKTSAVPTAPNMPGESPWPKRAAQIVGVLVVLGLIGIVLFTKPELRGVPDGTDTVAITTSEHVSGNVYGLTDVPAGGAMDEIWQNCGFYDTQVRAENVVHSMEHGAVWVAYDPNLAPDEISRLRGFANPIEKVLVSPIAGQDASIIVSAWGRQLELNDTLDERLAQFVNEFTGASSAPEPGGRCNGGVGQPQF